MAESVVYFAKNLSTGLVKIGFSRQLKTRIQGLQTQYECKIEIIRTVPGSRETEKAFHALFRDRRVKREWFEYDELMLSTQVSVQEPQGGDGFFSLMFALCPELISFYKNSFPDNDCPEPYRLVDAATGNPVEFHSSLERFILNVASAALAETLDPTSRAIETGEF